MHCLLFGVISNGSPVIVVLIPVDKVMIAESSGAPGVPIIYRAAEERAANPDRLNLDRFALIPSSLLLLHNMRYKTIWN